MSKSYKPVILLVLDGLGVPQTPENPIIEAKRPTFEEIEKFFPFTTLQASSVAVGLPWGEEGNSEVGHLTMGSGRAIYHHLPRIITSIQDGSFFENEALVKAVKHVKDFSSDIHFIGLFSSGSVHAYVDHLYALMEMAKKQELKNVYLHLFTDGRDAPPKEAGTFFKEFLERISKNYSFVKIVSLIGREFAMDRDERWEKIEQAYNLFTLGKGKSYINAGSYIQDEYRDGKTDEFIEPGYLQDGNGEAEGRIKRGDAVVFFNFREDSARELTRAFVEEKFDKFSREKLENLLFVTMTEYEKSLPAEVAFPSLDISWPLARVISEAGLKQLHIAETEKYAHVTYFFNGGKERPYPLEERILIPSLPGIHFDERPEMSADKITDTIIENLSKYDFILANFANADMVGHTGDFDATVKALEVLDFSVGKIMTAVLELGGIIIITGDHGNAEEKRYRHTGEKRTKHTINPVPFYLISGDLRSAEEKTPAEIMDRHKKVSGMLTDVAPSILELLNLPQPAEMTGVSLLPRLIEK